MRPGGNLMVVFSFLQEIDGLKSLMSECPEDKDMLDLATEELSQATEEEKRLQSLLLKSLLPKDDADERDSILEVRAGNKYPVKIDIYVPVLLRPTSLVSMCSKIFFRHLFSFSCLLMMDGTFNQEPEGKRLLCLQWTYLKCRLLQLVLHHK